MSNFWENLIGYWDWKTISGGNFVNLANPGTGDGAPTGFVGDWSELVDTDHGQAIDFGGTGNKKLSVGAGSFLNFTGEAFSIEAWGNSTNGGASYSGLFRKGNDLIFVKRKNNLGILLFRNSAGTQQTRATAASQRIALDDTGMHQHVCTHDGAGRIRLYIDGAECTYDFISVHTFGDASADVGYIYGSAVVNESFRGYGGCLRVWQGRELGAAEIWELWRMQGKRFG